MLPNRSLALLAFVIIISAFTGYRIGMSNQSMLMSLPHYSIENYHYTLSTSSSSTTTLHKLTQIASTARSNSINESDLPYSCGVLLFYHVPCTGGATMNNYLVDHSTQRNGTAEYFTFWSGDAASKTLEKREWTARKFIHGVDQLVENVSATDNNGGGGGGWRIVHLHHNSFHLNESESILSNWRNIVESKGCHFVASILFREALMHSLALHKIYVGKNISKEEFISHLASSDSSRLSRYDFETQLDYFLYNKIVRNPYLVSAKEKVDRALELLARHFDIISVGEHEKFKERIQQFTGWNDDNEEMKRKNIYRGEIHFTKREVENLQKLLEANGDIDFLEKVKLLFGNTTSA